MADRVELLEAALDSLGGGRGSRRSEWRVALWNRAAETITDSTSGETVGARCARHWMRWWWAARSTGSGRPMRRRRPGRGSLVHVRHKVGHEVPVMARVLVLRDAMGARIGTGVVFHPAESLDALPHGELGEDSNVGESQAELEDRLAAMHEDFLHSDIAARGVVGDGRPGARVAQDAWSEGLRGDAREGGADAGNGTETG